MSSSNNMEVKYMQGVKGHSRDLSYYLENNRSQKNGSSKSGTRVLFWLCVENRLGR
jgi:hypothetical protein